MTKFYAPYNFAPATGKCDGKVVSTIDSEAIAAGTSEHPARHDLWLPGTHSGRLLCRLTTTSPLVIGAHQEPADPNRGQDSPTRVQPYRDADGHPAIPASSLRGMIGSMAETLSQSSLRVLGERSYSTRKSVRESLPGIGRLGLAADGTLRLQPLAFPMLASGSTLNRAWLRAFRIVPSARDVATQVGRYLAAYVHGYQRDGLGIRVQPGSFLDQGTGLVSSTDDPPTHWYAERRIPQLQWDSRNFSVRYADPTLHGKKKPLVAHIEGVPSRAPGAGRTPGRLKVLGFQGHETQVPQSKKHEIFVPAPDDSIPWLRVSVGVRATFAALLTDAREREDYLPFHNAGAPPDLEEAARQGQLVFFDVEERREQVRVCELSYSAIWRRRAPGSLHQSFASISPNLPPLNQSRQQLTPAELLFGVVREECKASKDDPASNTGESRFTGLASRLRFTDALTDVDIELEPEKKLQILASPKPPSPSMYFGQDGRPVDKAKLDLGHQHPNGRKVYLPFPHDQRNTAAASTRDEDPQRDRQRLLVTPIPAGKSFYFEVRLENLTNAELGLLLRALRPAVAFEHRLGLGKPLGLGHVQIEVLALDDRQRAQRYSAAAFLAEPAPLAFADTSRPPNALPEPYAHWLTRLQQPPSQPWQADAPADHFDQSLIDPDTLARVAKLGDVAQLEDGVPVCYPRSSGQFGHDGTPRGEDKLFEWFVNNDRRNSEQKLAAVSLDESLPTLRSNTPP